MLHIGVLPHHRQWGDFLANLGWVVVDEAHTYRGVFGSHVANVLRRLRRVARAYGAEPRFLLASATIANPRRAGGAAGRHRVRADRRRRRAARRPRDRDVEPAADRRGVGGAALAALGGGRPAGRPRRPRRADDLLPAQPARDRADPALRPRQPARARQARAGGPDRSLPRRLHAAAAARDRGPPRRRRAARRRRHRRARARDRHRRARRGDLRHLPRHRRQPAPDVGAGRAPAPRPRRLRRRPGRARPVLLPPPGRVPRPPGRGGDPRPRLRADRRPAPGRRRLRAAAHRRGRRGLRPGLGGAGRAAGRRRRAAPRRRQAAAPAQRLRRLADRRCARPRPTRSR